MKRIQGGQKRTHAKVSIGLLNRIQYLASLKKLYILITRHIGAYILGHLVGMSYARWKIEIKSESRDVTGPLVSVAIEIRIQNQISLDFSWKKLVRVCSKSTTTCIVSGLDFFRYILIYLPWRQCDVPEASEEGTLTSSVTSSLPFSTLHPDNCNHILQPRAWSWIHTQYSVE